MVQTSAEQCVYRGVVQAGLLAFEMFFANVTFKDEEGAIVNHGDPALAMTPCISLGILCTPS